MRMTILMVAVAAVLVQPVAIGHALESQKAADVVTSGSEMSLAHCGQGGTARRDWVVIADATAASGTAIEHVQVPRTDAAGGLAVCQSAPVTDGDLSLRFKASSGASRQGGGLAFRMVSPKDYYLVTVDALRDRVALLQMRDGVAEEIIGVDADVEADAWHTLAVRAQDDCFIVYLDGSWIFTGYDKTLTHAGRIALWTEPGSIIRFDRVTIGSIPKPRAWQ
jgi:hypothetical protein